MSERIRLGRSELTVSPICFGCWQASPVYWGDQPKETLIAAMRRAFEVGVNFFDTADAYGDGRSEEILGEALADLPRDKLIVATKVYHHFYPDGRRHPDLSGPYIEEECEASLRRLKMDYVDLYQCHAFDPLTPQEETTAALGKLKKAGKIRAYGVSNYSVEQLRLARQHGDYDTLQPRYSLLDLDIEKDLLPYCLANDIGVLVYSPLSRGLLTGKYRGNEEFDDLRKNSVRFQNDLFHDICEKVRGLQEIADKYGMTIVQLVLTATRMHPAVHCPIVGIKRPEQIEEAAAALGKTIDREDYFAVRKQLT